MAGGKYPAWCRSPEEVAAHHGSDVSKGLTSKQVETQRAKYGFNELEKEPGKPLWKLVLEQFDDALVKILLLAAMVSLLLAFLEEDGHEGIRAYIEPLVILLILVLNAIVGVWQESNAENALEALKEMQSEHAKTMRNGVWVSDLAAKELVPGDIVELHVGDKVPADMRVIHLKTATLRLEQASLTGESVAVNKQEDAAGDEDCEIQAKESMLFAGTAVANGSCIAIVNDIGMKTEIGEIQEAIQEAAGEEDDTPLKKKLDEFGELLTKVIGVVCLLVWLMNYKFFISWKTDPDSFLPKDIKFDFSQCTYYFKIAVALAVAAIPEGLPAVITTCLALGTRKMAQKNAIVRKLPSVETLGCTTVICSDKTGTLTTNQMSAIVLVAMDKSDIRVFDVEGSTYNPTAGKVVGLKGVDANLAEIARVATICNEATVEFKEGAWVAIGAPTEAALKVLAEKIGADGATGDLGVSDLWLGSTEKLATLEFDRDRKSMSCIVTAGTGGAAGRATRATRAKSPGAGGENTLLVKGAPESVLERCNYVMTPDGKVEKLTVAMRQAVARQFEGMSKKALRCLAMAIKHGDALGPLSTYDGPHHPAHKQLLDPANYSGIESDLVLVGLAGLQDPPRPEVGVSIAECNNAGIRVMMITGDNKLTAEAIAQNIGIIHDGVDLGKASMTGRDFMSMPKNKQIAFLAGGGGRVFSRAEPRHKQEIVRLLKDQGEITAMTGDGVNDAPALKLADIGVAMGIAGTEVAKEASDMVLADDNFSSIVAAVAEGRSIFNNMKAFIRYMISSNIGEVASIFLTAALGMPEGLIPVQLLWVNLVTDGPPATALGFNPADPDIMDKPPRKSDDPLITPWVFFRYMVVGVYVGFATVAAFAIWFLYTDFMGLDLSADGHSTVTWYQLTHWQECKAGGPEWRGFKVSPYTAGGQTIDFSRDPCEIFDDGKAKASTLSLSVLVAIEMFNAVNALSEDNSLVSVPPWVNPYLIVAMVVSFGLHFVILYVPFFCDIFSIVPLNVNEWILVVGLAFPVIVIDEVLKFVGRIKEKAAIAAYKKEH